MDVVSLAHVAARITNPISAACFIGLLVLLLAIYVARAGRPIRNVKTVVGLVFGLVILGVLPLLTNVYEKTRSLYRIRVVALGTDGLPHEDTSVICLPSGEEKKVTGRSECDVPPTVLPSTHVFTALAKAEGDFLTGSGQLTLGSDLNPTMTIAMTKYSEAMISGIVEDEKAAGVGGAWVSIVGCELSGTRSDEHGRFALLSHAAPGRC